MTAHDLALLVLCYGLGYSLLRHCNIGIALVGLLVVGFFTSQRHGDESAVLIAYGLGVVACWLIKRGVFRLESHFYGSWLRWTLTTFKPWPWWRDRSEHAASEDPANGRPWTETETDNCSAGDPRSEETRKHRAEEAKQRWQQEDARKGGRGRSGSEQRQENAQAHTEEPPKQKQRRKQQEQEREPWSEQKQEKAQTGQQKEPGKTVTEPLTDTRTPEEVLAVRPGCSLEELKQAYRQQCQRLHPDRWQDRPPHIRTMLEEEQKRVNVAFQTLEKRFK